MEDSRIIELYWARSEEAITASSEKYGGHCYAIAQRILCQSEDSRECVNDTWLRAWNSIPPSRPDSLKAFLGTITRRLALDRRRCDRAEKRGGGEVTLALEELRDCVASPACVERGAEEGELAELLDRFLASLSKEARIIFLQRYWYLCPVKQIARHRGISESGVKMSLLRSRKKLKALLDKELRHE